ncbi:unnamed protein product [Polarella glacialis]|uniref:Uncharacterized protein n=1 Tax=Polarella glacialis TaxID=89957 RepID=A0A813D9M8_POLGL|nr:unnamed protein product [Polarella glacialis]
MSPDGGSILQRNCAVAKTVMRQALAKLSAQCDEEEEQYLRTRTTPSRQKKNRWALYTSPDRVQSLIADSLRFVRHHPECRLRKLSEEQLRFLMLLQHLVAEDTLDFFRPEEDRKHSDSFEGILTTAAVNSQLVKDAHRSEWTVEGRSFSMQAELSEKSFEVMQDRRRLITAFQEELVMSLENLLLDYGRRRGLSEPGQVRLVQAVTTQMSQCGLANLDRSSQAAKYFVSGQGLEQRTAYNISVMDAGLPSEALQLSLFCIKTNFTTYHTEGGLEMLSAGDEEGGPDTCDPSSYLYQYATLRFRTLPPVAPGCCEMTECVVIDALDEVG